MGKALLQFILLFSSGAWAKLTQYSSRNNSIPDHGALLFKTRKRLRQIVGPLRFPIWKPLIRFALLAGITILSFPINAPAAQVTLAWEDKNQAVDGFQVFQRTEGSAFDYAKPVWTTDGRDPNKTSCTISGLADGIKYHFVVRAYADDKQSPNSNQVTYMAPASSPITIVNDNHPPVAEAGANKSVNAGDWVVLDASGSSDPDGDRLSYAWIQRSGPAVDLSCDNDAQCGFTAPMPMDEPVAMVFELEVTDAKRESCADTCIVLIHAVDQGLTSDEDPGHAKGGVNSPPEQPALESVTDDENSGSSPPLLRASAFVDRNPGDYHALTEWCIFLMDGRQQVVFDRTCGKGRLTEIQVPPMVLHPSTAYSAQVRFFDDRGLPSPWSRPVTFTTSADSNDKNHNNVPDSQEVFAVVDMNSDTITDLNQASLVKTLATYNQQHRFCVSVELNDPTIQIQAAASFSPETMISSAETALFSEDEMPYGFLGYRIKVEEPGEIIAVKFYLSDPLDSGKIRWARHDAVDGITSCDASTDIDDSGLQVSRYLVDGGEEDADGVANGVIIDLAGPRRADASDHPDDSSLAVPNTGSAASSGSSGGCFILSLD